jgi:hypothetical protein
LQAAGGLMFVRTQGLNPFAADFAAFCKRLIPAVPEQFPVQTSRNFAVILTVPDSLWIEALTTDVI